MLKLGFTLQNLAIICSHKSTNHKFYQFFEGDKDFCEKIREDVTGSPPIVFRRKAVVDQTYIRKSSNICKTIVGTDASQLYPFSMCQDMPTGLYTRWEYDSETDRFKTRNNRTRIFEHGYVELSFQSLSEQDIERGNKKREMIELRAEYIKVKGCNFQEIWECEWWEHFKTDSSVKNRVKTNFPYRRPLSTDSLLEKNKERISFWLSAL